MTAAAAVEKRKVQSARRILDRIAHFPIARDLESGAGYVSKTVPVD